jgi:hypothetical protein
MATLIFLLWFLLIRGEFMPHRSIFLARQSPCRIDACNLEWIFKTQQYPLVSLENANPATLIFLLWFLLLRGELMPQRSIFFARQYLCSLDARPLEWILSTTITTCIPWKWLIRQLWYFCFDYYYNREFMSKRSIFFARQSPWRMDARRLE